MRTIHTAIKQAVENGAIEFIAMDYAEPGYHKDGERDILFANWNPPALGRLARLAERAGYTTEWSDEWASCDVCGKAVRTSADSYSWVPSFVRYDHTGDQECHGCVNPEEWLAYLEGRPDHQLTLDVDPEEHGYHKVNTESYEHGWYGGQNDSPEILAADLQARGISRFVFRLDAVGQFDTKFSLYVHQEDLSLLGAREVNSKLPYDPGTEMGKALRGDPTPHYRVESRLITPVEFVSGEWLKKKQS